MLNLITFSESESDEDTLVQQRKVRRFNERNDYLETLDDDEFLSRFRLSKNSCIEIYEKIREEIEPSTKRSHAIKGITKLLATLRFYATGSFLKMIGDFSGVSESSMSRIVKQTSEAIAKLRPEFIRMPSTQNERQEVYEEFYKIANFPTVIGTIDGTHIKILSPGGENAELYRNRKQFFSINVQSISNAKLMFQDIVARWPGSTHDSHIFNMSAIKQRFERNEFDHGVLLADGGYKLYSYMLTPFRNVNTLEERAFNRAQIKTRNTVERKYGVWKRRFPCLSLGLRCKTETALTIIVACAVLHNICIINKDKDPEIDEETRVAIEETCMEAIQQSEVIENITRSQNRQGIMKRNSIATQIYQIMNTN